jgi:hypothetical protein
MRKKLVDLADLRGACIRATPEVAEFLETLDDVAIGLLYRLARRVPLTEGETGAFMYPMIRRRVIVDYESKRVVADPSAKRPKFRKEVTLLRIHADAKSFQRPNLLSILRRVRLLASVIRISRNFWDWIRHVH